ERVGLVVGSSRTVVAGHPGARPGRRVVGDGGVVEAAAGTGAHAGDEEPRSIRADGQGLGVVERLRRPVVSARPRRRARRLGRRARGDAGCHREREQRHSLPPPHGSTLAVPSTPVNGGRRIRKRRTDRCPARSRGLSASSIACPVIVHATTTAITPRPGGTIAHQALFRIASSVNAFSIRRPQEILLGSPRPRNVMNVSAKIAYAISRIVFAISSGITCGSTCRVIRRKLPAPSARTRRT